MPNPDAALFLAAIDHQTGYTEPHEVDGEGPYEGSALLWALGLRAERRAPGALTARSLLGVDPRGDRRGLPGRPGHARTTRSAAPSSGTTSPPGLLKNYGGQAEALIDASGGKLGGPSGALFRLGGFDAFSDPLRKKAFLVCKIWERRGWLEVSDPENWEVSRRQRPDAARAALRPGRARATSRRSGRRPAMPSSRSPSRRRCRPRARRPALGEGPRGPRPDRRRGRRPERAAARARASSSTGDADPTAIYERCSSTPARRRRTSAAGSSGAMDGEARTLYRATQRRGEPAPLHARPQGPVPDHSARSPRTARRCSAIYHSHTASPAYPSQTDINLATYPDSIYLILSLAEGEAAAARLPHRRRRGQRGRADRRVTSG